MEITFEDPGRLQADGECDTEDLNNCEHEGELAADVYRVVGCVEVEVVAEDKCPDGVDFGKLPACDSQSLKPGDYCEGGGECGTDQDENNCVHDGKRQADVADGVS